jgi:hypothetical protein
VTFARQALDFVRKTPVVPFFGPTTGFVVNYTPDQAVRFDLDAKPVERRPHAYSPGEITLRLGKRKIAPEEFETPLVAILSVGHLHADLIAIAPGNSGLRRFQAMTTPALPANISCAYRLKPKPLRPENRYDFSASRLRRANG